jgi:hypothetical protein
VTQAWGQLEAAKAQINATQAQVTAAEVALNGVREEARVGQRTTLDVLNAQQDLVNARVALVTAQRDRVVASYTVLAATGALSAQVLALKIEVYDPVTHYQQVRNVWGGVRTPDGADTELETRGTAPPRGEAAATTRGELGADHRCSTEEPCAAGIASRATLTAPSDQQSVKRPMDAQSFRIDWPRSLSLRAGSEPITGTALAGAYRRLVRMPSPFRGLQKDI